MSNSGGDCGHLCLASAFHGIVSTVSSLILLFEFLIGTIF